MAPIILNLRTRVEWLTSRLGRFTPKKEHRYSLNSRLGGPRSRSERFGEKNFLTLPGFKPRTVQPVA
jgi:hypothetical protein